VAAERLDDRRDTEIEGVTISELYELRSETVLQVRGVG
jgi:hypothetical protein